MKKRKEKGGEKVTRKGNTQKWQGVCRKGENCICKNIGLYYGRPPTHY
jgi:hypothetical protein